MKETDFYEKNKDKDYIIIKLTDEFPYFKEKVFYKSGKERIDKSYHLANGLYSTYINYEIPNIGIAAEITRYPVFEIAGSYDCPIYIMNAGDHEIEYGLVGWEWDKYGIIESGEILQIWPWESAQETERRAEACMKGIVRSGIGVTQAEINRLLDGNI